MISLSHDELHESVAAIAFLFPELFMQEFLHGVGVPLVNAQSLHHLLVVIKKQQLRIGAARVLDVKARELLDAITLYKS